MDSVHSRLVDLTQAVAQGRLALAEVAAISGDELDAIYETAVMRLDTGRPVEGAKMLAALVVLYPFAHEYWRAYAIALMRLGERQAAMRATDMARALAPNQGAALAAELLGETGHLDATNPRIEGQAEITATNVGAPVEITQTDVKRADEVTDAHIDTSTAFADEITASGVAEPTQPEARPRRSEPRITWPVESDQPSAPEVTPRLAVPERSMTALVDRRPRTMEHSDTARIDRRTRRRVQPAPLHYDDSLTAIVRRRAGAPIGEDV